MELANAPNAGNITFFPFQGRSELKVDAPGTFTTSTGDEGGSLINGAKHTGTITLGDIDVWTISAVQGDVIVASIGATRTAVPIDG